MAVKNLDSGAVPAQHRPHFLARLYRRIPRFRFSLLTLMLLALSTGGVLTLSLNWRPWYQCCKIQMRPDEQDTEFISMSADGQRVVVLNSDGLCRVYDASTGVQTRMRRALFSSAAIPDDAPACKLIVETDRGPLLVTVRGGKSIEPPEPVWQQQLRKEFSVPVSFEINDLPFSEALLFLKEVLARHKIDASKIKVDESVHIRDQPITLRVADLPFETAVSWIAIIADLSIEWRRDGLWIVPKKTAEEVALRTACVWDLETGACLGSFRAEEPLRWLAISGDGTRLAASSSSEKGCHVWDIPRALEICRVGPVQHSMSLSHDGRTLAGISTDDAVSIWNTDDGREVGRCQGTYSNVVVAPDNQHLMCEKRDSAEFELCDRTGRTILYETKDTPAFARGSRKRQALFANKGLRLVSEFGSNQIVVHDTKDGQKRSHFPAYIRDYLIPFHSDGRVLNFGGGWSEIFDIEKGELLAEIPGPAPWPTHAYYQAKYIVDVYFGTLENTPFARVIESHLPSVSRDGNTLVTGSRTEFEVWKRRRPEWWWGVFVLPQLWVAVALSVALIWSLRRDYRSFV